MSLTIVAMLLFSLALLFVDNKNKYSYFFILMMSGMALAMMSIIVEIAKNSNYLLPPGYIFRNVENMIYYQINRILRIPLSTLLIIRNSGVTIYLSAMILFVSSFNKSIASDDEKRGFRRHIVVRNFLPVYPVFYFIFYHPESAYRIYVHGKQLSGTQMNNWFSILEIMDIAAIVLAALYLVYPIVYLLLNQLRNGITFFAEQLLGLAVSLALLNCLFFYMFFLGTFRLSAASVIRSGLWRYSFLERIPQFYITMLPFLMLLIECIILYIIIRFRATDFINALKSRMMRKNIGALYQNQRDILHSNKNQMFRLKLLADEALTHYGQDTGKEKLEEIRNLCEGNMETISRTLDYIKVFTIHTVSNDFVQVVENALRIAAVPEEIEVIKDYRQPSISGYFDEYHIEQSLVDLIINAVDAIQSKYGGAAQIRITVNASVNWIYCMITDTGCGIPRKMLKRIFDPYVSTKSKQNNWGMGLAYVQRIVKAHYGQIRFRSNPAKSETVAEILLPRSLRNRKKMITPVSD